MSDQPADHSVPEALPQSHSEIVEPESRWPKNLGVFSIMYAALGLTCTGVGITWVIIMPFIPEMFRGGAVMPPIVKITNLVVFVLGMIAGIMLLRAAILLVKRKRGGVSLMKAWVVFRLVLVLIGVAAFVVTLPAQVEMSKSQYEFVNRSRVASGMPEHDIPTDDVLIRNTMIGVVAGATLPSIFPLFVGFYLSRTSITDEVSTWP